MRPGVEDPARAAHPPLVAAPSGQIADAPALAGIPAGLLLASIGDAGYPIAPRRVLATGIAAAAVVDLGFRRRVFLDGGRLLLGDRARSGDPVTDPVIERLALRRKAPFVDRCLEELALDWTIMGRAGQALEAAGLVRIERRALHPLIMHRFHALPDSRPAGQRRMLRSILDGRADAAAHELALASLAATVGLLRPSPAAFADPPAGPSAAARTLEATAAGEILAAVLPVLVAAGTRPVAAGERAARGLHSA